MTGKILTMFIWVFPLFLLIPLVFAATNEKVKYRFYRCFVCSDGEIY